MRAHLHAQPQLFAGFVNLGRLSAVMPPLVKKVLVTPTSMLGVKKVLVTPTGKIRRIGSPTPSTASTVASSSVVDRRISKDKHDVFTALTAYLGGNTMNMAKYESIFGDLSRLSPFGEHIWDGLISYFYCGYVDNYGTKFEWCGDRRQCTPWLGAYNMPNKFSKHVSASPIVDDDSRPSLALYPSVFLLTPEQNGYLKSIISSKRHSASIIFGSGVVESDDDDDDVDDDDDDAADMYAKDAAAVDINASIVDSAVMGPVYMVCLKIMIGGSRPWHVNMDHIHLYTPFPLSRL